MKQTVLAKQAFLDEVLKEGEIYAGAIIKPDGTGNHVIILPGDYDDANWNDSMEWAKSLGGDLPDRVEQALFYQQLPNHFQKDWYWSNTLYASTSDYAWCQNFDYSGQCYDYIYSKCRARCVRRLEIKLVFEQEPACC